MVQTRAATLLAMIASLEETIVRLESDGDGDACETIRRLRAVERDILAALRLAEK